MRNRILGITALVAVLALGMAFIACPAVDNDVREVIFENQTNSKMDVIFDGSPILSLEASTPADVGTGNYQRGKVTRTGQDIILAGVTFTGSVGSNFDWTDYLEITGTALGGETKKGQSGIPLKTGVLVFKPAVIPGGNPFALNKISTIQQDE